MKSGIGENSSLALNLKPPISKKLVKRNNKKEISLLILLVFDS